MEGAEPRLRCIFFSTPLMLEPAIHGSVAVLVPWVGSSTRSPPPAPPQFMQLRADASVICTESAALQVSPAVCKHVSKQTVQWRSQVFHDSSVVLGRPLNGDPSESCFWLS